MASGKWFFPIVNFDEKPTPPFLPKKIQCKQLSKNLEATLSCVALLHDMYYTINYLNSHDILLQPVSLIQPWWKKRKSKENEKRKKV